MSKYKTYKLVESRKIFFTVSLVLVSLAFILSFILGVDIDIQFKGGTMMSYEYSGEIDVSEFRAAAEEISGLTVNVTLGTSFASDSKTINMNFTSNEGITADRQFEITQFLQDSFLDNDLTLFDSSDVSPTSGREFFNKCIVAVSLAAALLVVFIALRFSRIGGWSAGVMSIVALVHDIIMVYLTFVVCRFPINANFMAVVLTIFGYSLNDTIVIYDRIRENRKLLGNKIGYGELVNMSVSQSLRRSLNTSISTIIAMLCVCVVSLFFGVTSIISFAFPLVIGLISGTYSSLCIAGPLWVMWNERKGNNSRKPGAKKKKVTAV